MLTAALADREGEELAPWAAALLVEMEARLDDDLGLESLARAWGASPYKFHRLYSAVVGETPKRSVLRLRLERAARLLVICDKRVLDIALAVGFQSHEAFTRAFRRAFALTPTQYRARERAAREVRARRRAGFGGWCCQLSEVRFERRPAADLIAIRQFGAYAGFPPRSRQRLWDELGDWAKACGVSAGSERLGLFPDDPMLTPGPRQGADYCLAVFGPVAGDARVRAVRLAGGVHAVIDHFGPYETLIQAYRIAHDVICRSDRYDLRDEPPLQIFRTVAEDGNPSANRTEVWIPVRSAG